MAYLLIFFRLIVRPLRREPLRTLLTASAVALGVAVVLAIELAGDAAAGSFHSSMETLTGDADLEVTATGGLSPDVWARLAALPYPLRFEPRIEDFGEIAGTGRSVTIVGVDLLSIEKGALLAGPSLGYKIGDRLKLAANDTVGDFVVRGQLAKGSGDTVVMDLATAGNFLGRDRLDRILVHTPAGKTLEQWQSILAAASGATVARTGSRTNENRRMMEAFRWNLRVLSYIALVVGAFLIYNTISVSVVRRRAEIGVARALGATRGIVLAAFLGEAACFGLAGSLAGIALGRVMAEGAVKAVGATVTSLYVSSTPGEIHLSVGIVLLAFCIGIGMAVVSALAPAWEAAQVVPVEAMSRGRREHQVRMHRWRDLAIAGGLALAAWLASTQDAVAGKPLFGYLAALLAIAASSFAIPAFVSTLAHFKSRMFGVEALLAARGLSASLRRTSVLVGALATAIAMMAAVGIMVGSFRETIIVWMDDQLQADLYLRPAVAPGVDRHPTMPAESADEIEKLSQVAAVDRFRVYDISYQGLPALLGGADARVTKRYGNRRMLPGAASGNSGADNALVSEPFANKHHVHVGDMLPLTLGQQVVHFRVTGIYYDYSNERGYVIVDRPTLLKYLPDTALSNIAVYLKPGASLEAGKKAVQAAIAGHRIEARDNRVLREDAIQIFDRTFAITYALEGVAVIVAIMGVAGALLALVIDRRREFGLLRFLGGAKGQVARVILFEAGLLGLLANIAGVILGALLSLLLIFVINKQSFGWTIQFHWPVAVLLVALTAVYMATVLASLYPAPVAMQLNPIEVIHEE
jgi:putative ABC transport system permease protein